MFKGKSVAYFVGFFVGIALVFAIAKLISIIFKKSKWTDGNYDERQLIARGKAAMIGFITFCFWEVFSWGITSLVEITFISESVWHFLGFLVGLDVFLIACVWKDAYFYFEKEKNIKGFYAFLIIYIIVNGVLFFTGSGFRECLETGVLEGPSACNLLVVIFLLVLFVNIIIKRRIEKKNLQKSEE